LCVCVCVCVCVRAVCTEDEFCLWVYLLISGMYIVYIMNLCCILHTSIYSRLYATRTCIV